MHGSQKAFGRARPHREAMALQERGCTDLMNPQNSPASQAVTPGRSKASAHRLPAYHRHQASMCTTTQTSSCTCCLSLASPSSLNPPFSKLSLCVHSSHYLWSETPISNRSDTCPAACIIQGIHTPHLCPWLPPTATVHPSTTAPPLFSQNCSTRCLSGPQTAD